MPEHMTHPMRRIAAWLYVGIPAAWGVAQVAIKSAALFR